jgi:hypothetical protein
MIVVVLGGVRPASIGSEQRVEDAERGQHRRSGEKLGLGAIPALMEVRRR